MRKEKEHGLHLEGLNVSTMNEIKTTLYSSSAMRSSPHTGFMYTGCVQHSGPSG